jgi:hypothetical protein
MTSWADQVLGQNLRCDDSAEQGTTIVNDAGPVPKGLAQRCLEAPCVTLVS